MYPSECCKHANSAEDADTVVDASRSADSADDADRLSNPSDALVRATLAENVILTQEYQDECT